VRQEWWPPLAWAALGLLIAEWLVQHRGSLARLLTPLRPSARGLQPAARNPRE
jgi:hypothetical protein